MSLIIYTTGPLCSRCNALKDAFQRAAIFYQEYPLDSRAISDCLIDTGELVNSAPLVKDGAVWFFASDFFDANGGLVANWRQVLEGIKPVKQFTGSGGQPSGKVQACRGIWGD